MIPEKVSEGGSYFGFFQLVNHSLPIDYRQVDKPLELAQVCQNMRVCKNTAPISVDKYRVISSISSFIQ